MAETLKTVILFLMTPNCYDEYFVNFNFFHGECFRSTLSKVLGLVIVAGSLTVKVPQIMKIINSKSGKGISITGAALDLTAISSFFLYGYLKQYPFSSWGEGLFLLIQTAAIVGLIYYYQSSFTQLILFFITFFTLLTLFLTQIIPLSFLWVMQFLNLPIIVLAKFWFRLVRWKELFQGYFPSWLTSADDQEQGIQALTNYRNKSTGQLSAVTCWLQFGGATARVFTSVQETGDVAMVLSFIFASILNGILVFQLLYYAKPTSKKAKGKGKGKKSI